MWYIEYAKNWRQKWFNKWARKNALSDKALIDTIDNVSANLGSVNLGGGLFKVRTPKIGKGKSGGFRTILIFKEKEIAIFVYGFAKTDKDNLDREELKYFKMLAKDLIKIKSSELVKLKKQGSFISLKV